MERNGVGCASAPTVIGIDIGKEIFHLVGFDADGKIVLRRKIKRLALADTFSKLGPCVVGMEACLSAHFVSRALRALGHSPRIIPAIYVKPFLKGQKNDYNDAEAIAEAALRPNLRTVRQKTQEELDLQAYHRIRSRLVSRRTATINQIRAFLIEQGIAGYCQVNSRWPQNPERAEFDRAAAVAAAHVWWASARKRRRVGRRIRWVWVLKTL